MTEALSQRRFGFAARLSGLYAAIFILGGVTLPFLPVWLAAKGLDARTIGLVLAAPMLLRVFAIPLAARQADRRDALRGVIVVASLLTLRRLCRGRPVGRRDRHPDRVSLVALAYTPIMPLAESYALRGLTARGRAYGPVRLWGSAAFILGSFVAGFAARHHSGAASDLADRRRLRAAGAAPPSCSSRCRRRRRAADAPPPRQGAAARSGLHRGDGGGQPAAGQPRHLLRLLGAGLGRRRL